MGSLYADTTLIFLLASLIQALSLVHSSEFLVLSTALLVVVILQKLKVPCSFPKHLIQVANYSHQLETVHPEIRNLVLSHL